MWQEKNKKLKEKIITFIQRQEDKRATSFEIVNTFYKMKRCKPALALQMIQKLLKDDSRFILTEDDFWIVNSVEELIGKKLQDTRISLVYLITKDINYRKGVPFGLGIKSFLPRKVQSLFVPFDPGIKIKDEDLISMSFERDAKLFKINSMKNNILRLLDQAIIFSFRPSPLLEFFYRYDIHPQTKIFSVLKLFNIIRGNIKLTKIPQLISEMDYPYDNLNHIRNMISVLEETKDIILEDLKELGITTLDGLVKLYESAAFNFNFDQKTFDHNFLRNIPVTPGIYRFRNEKSNVIYIGKSKNLNSRVNSYFIISPKVSDKIKRIQEQVNEIDLEPTPTELDAIIKEYREIKKFNPEINIQTNVKQTLNKIIMKGIPERFIIMLPDLNQKYVNLILGTTAGIFSTKRFQKNQKKRISNWIEKILFNENNQKSDLSEFTLFIQWIKRNKNKLNMINLD
ncbi:nucleotide excision repair endonuclease, partial [Candidatus Dependentiae bacterium]|nr:nucleotide excision repair endonuclease [Candidatus Dependentiae bacterium]